MSCFGSHCVQRNWNDPLCSEKLQCLLVNEEKALKEAAIRKYWKKKMRHCKPEQGEELIIEHVWVSHKFFNILPVYSNFFFWMEKYILLLLKEGWQSCENENWHLIDLQELNSKRKPEESNSSSKKKVWSHGLFTSIVTMAEMGANESKYASTYPYPFF